MLRFPLCKIAKGIPVCSHDSDKGLQCTLKMQYLCPKIFLPWQYILILKCTYVLQNIHTSSAFHIVEGCCCPFSNPGYAMSCLPVEPFSSASSENVYKAIIRMSICLVRVVLWHLVSERIFGVMYDHTCSELANHQIRHQATHKVGCLPGDCIWSL